MKKWFIALCLILWTVTNVSAQDYVLIEQLIKSHKELSDKLKARVGVETATLATHHLLEEADKKYDGVTDSLSHRMASKLTDLSLLTDVTRLTVDAIQAVESSKRTYEYAFKMLIKYPFLQEQVAELNNQVAGRVTEIYRIIAMVTTNGLRISLGTPEQRYTFLNGIDERICWIARRMSIFYQFLRILEYHQKEYVKIQVPMDKESIYQRSLKQIDRMDTKF